MRLATFAVNGRTSYGIVTGDGIVDLGGAPFVATEDLAGGAAFPSSRDIQFDQAHRGDEPACVASVAHVLASHHPLPSARSHQSADFLVEQRFEDQPDRAQTER